VTETELEKAVRRILALNGHPRTVYGYHVADSRRSAAGWPDWVIIGGRGVLWRELKSAYGALTAEQRQVGYLLQAAGADWDVWRPLDFVTGRIAQEIAEIRT
jgi:hypothetical protein